MEVSELRKRILRALDEARKDAAARRQAVDDATAAYAGFLEHIAVPLMRQAAQILNSTGPSFSVHTPAGSVRLHADQSPQTFVELVLDATKAPVEVLGRTSVTRGRDGHLVERPIAPGKPVAELSEEDVATFLLAEIPKLIVRS
ncbi:MAG: hypothetical protein IT184_04495 [Acidobacteria bacterium]|nr:hypothetical protein [Acidobacteriota bacterium]